MTVVHPSPSKKCLNDDVVWSKSLLCTTLKLYTINVMSFLSDMYSNIDLKGLQ